MNRPGQGWAFSRGHRKKGEGGKEAAAGMGAAWLRARHTKEWPGQEKLERQHRLSSGCGGSTALPTP